MGVIDKKGMTGKSVEYKSYPLMYNKGFIVETEGHLMSGPQVEVFTHDDNIEQELAKGQKDNVWLYTRCFLKKCSTILSKKLRLTKRSYLLIIVQLRCWHISGGMSAVLAIS